MIKNWGKNLKKNPETLVKSLVFPYAGTGVNSVHKKSQEKEELCQRLKEQLDALEKETASKLAEMDEFNSQLKVLVLSKYPMAVSTVFYFFIKIGATFTRLPKSFCQLPVSNKNYQKSWRKQYNKNALKPIANVLKYESLANYCFA